MTYPPTDSLRAAFRALNADPGKDEHRRYRGTDQHLCMGIGCTTWISDELPSVLCAVCLIRVRRSRGLHGDGSAIHNPSTGGQP